MASDSTPALSDGAVVPNSLADGPRLPRTPTGVRGLDHILNGGLPDGRVTLVGGTSGAGKTILSCEIAHREMTERGGAVVLVTFEESGADISRNVEGLGWDFAKQVDEGRLFIIDASPDPDVFTEGEAGGYDLSGVLAQLSHAIRTVDAGLVILDSLSGLFQQFSGTAVIRRELFRITSLLKRMGMRTVVTGERLADDGPVSRFGVEDFLADAVILMRQSLNQERVRRTIQVYKLRGDAHNAGEYPFTITSDGLYVMPLSEVGLQQQSETDRVEFGNVKLDEMNHGGFFRDSILLVAGPTGSGKTLLGTTFAAGGCAAGQKVIYFGFEESVEQLDRNAVSWGMSFAEWREKGLLRCVSRYPESAGLEGHLVAIREAVEAFRPDRVIIDSVSALERIAEVRLFREFVIGLTGYLKDQQVCTLMTSTSDDLSGGDSVTEQHISTITDAIVLLRYVERGGDIRRGLTIIKMRGSQHEKAVRQFEVSDRGLTIGDRFEDLDDKVLLGC